MTSTPQPPRITLFWVVACALAGALVGGLIVVLTHDQAESSTSWSGCTAAGAPLTCTMLPEETRPRWREVAPLPGVFGG